MELTRVYSAGVPDYGGNLVLGK